MADTLSFISSDITIRGDLKADEPLEVEGRIFGDIASSDRVTISETAWIEGDINARDIEVHGVVIGSVVAAGQLTLLSTAQLQGTLQASRLQVESGARIDAAVDANAGEGASATPAARRTSPKEASRRTSASASGRRAKAPKRSKDSRGSAVRKQKSPARSRKAEVVEIPEEAVAE